MSAPWEVWCDLLWDGILHGQVHDEEPKDVDDDSIARYLRADLTCGDCGTTARINGFGGHWWCDDRNASANDDAAACMGFVQKNKQVA